MKLLIVGTANGGLLAGARFAEHGHEVVCVDSEWCTSAGLQSGLLSVQDLGLRELVTRHCKGGRLTFAADLCGAARESEFLIVALDPSESARGERLAPNPMW